MLINPYRFGPTVLLPTLTSAVSDVNAGTSGTVHIALSGTNNGGDANTVWYAVSSPGGKVGSVANASVASGIYVSGLTNGTSYSFSVYGVNAAGTGPAKNTPWSIKPVSAPLQIYTSFGSQETGGSSVGAHPMGSVNLWATGGTGTYQFSWTGYNGLNPVGNTTISFQQSPDSKGPDFNFTATIANSPSTDVLRLTYYFRVTDDNGTTSNSYGVAINWN